MEYEDRIVCFMDILGFKAHVKKTDTKDNKENIKNIDNIASSIEAIRYFTDMDKPEGNEGKQITQFSDSLVISFLSDEESGVFNSLLTILWIQISLVRHGILCRGGIVRGKLVHTEKYLFGPAMVNAYTLESKAALYPRVILDESIIISGMKAHGKHHFAHHEKESIMSLLKKDSDGMYYIDYITESQSELDDPTYDYPQYMHELGQIIKEGLKSSDPSILIKYQWLKEKYVHHVKELKNIYKDDIDKDISDAYLCLPEFKINNLSTNKFSGRKKPRR